MPFTLNKWPLQKKICTSAMESFLFHQQMDYQHNQVPALTFPGSFPHFTNLVISRTQNMTNTLKRKAFWTLLTHILNKRYALSCFLTNGKMFFSGHSISPNLKPDHSLHLHCPALSKPPSCLTCITAINSLLTRLPAFTLTGSSLTFTQQPEGKRKLDPVIPLIKTFQWHPNMLRITARGLPGSTGTCKTWPLTLTLTSPPTTNQSSTVPWPYQQAPTWDFCTWCSLCLECSLPISLHGSLPRPYSNVTFREAVPKCPT